MLVGWFFGWKFTKQLPDQSVLGQSSDRHRAARQMMPFSSAAEADITLTQDLDMSVGQKYRVPKKPYW